MTLYAQFDPTSKQVVGWYDTEFADYTLPDQSQLITLTPEQWAARMANPSGWSVANGALVPYVAPPPDTRAAARAALDASDITMIRVSEAVSLGLTTWTAADVVAFAHWRRTLRAMVSGAPTTAAIPTMPAYPAST